MIWIASPKRWRGILLWALSYAVGVILVNLGLFYLPGWWGLAAAANAVLLLWFVCTAIVITALDRARQPFRIRDAYFLTAILSASAIHGLFFWEPLPSSLIPWVGPDFMTIFVASLPAAAAATLTLSWFVGRVNPAARRIAATATAIAFALVLPAYTILFRDRYEDRSYVAYFAFCGALIGGIVLKSIGRTQPKI